MFQPPDAPDIRDHPCALTDGTFDHDWKYDGGDPSVGCNAAWVCRTCGAVDAEREPPVDDGWGD